MISSGTPYEIWVARFVNPFIQEKTSREAFMNFLRVGIYMYVYALTCRLHLKHML